MGSPVLGSPILGRGVPGHGSPGHGMPGSQLVLRSELDVVVAEHAAADELRARQAREAKRVWEASLQSLFASHADAPGDAMKMNDVFVFAMLCDFFILSITMVPYSSPSARAERLLGPKSINRTRV